MTWYEKLLLVVGMVLFMECFAWATHKYVMHGWGWGWHRSHHEPHDGAFEKNDLYAITFAAIVIGLFVVGIYWEPLWWIALGITLYELAAGKNPFPQSDFATLIRAKLESDIPPPRSALPELDPFWDQVIATCARREKADRFASADELRRVLREGEKSEWWRLRTAGREHFASLDLSKLHALQELYAKSPQRGVKSASEDEMVRLYAHCTFNLNPRASSIDTPLHAFIPFQHVDHTHPNSVIAVAATRRSRENSHNSPGTSPASASDAGSSADRTTC